MHEWQWVSALKEDALQKHKTASHRGCYREGLHRQDDVSGDGGVLGAPWGVEVSPGETELCIKPQGFRARGWVMGSDKHPSWPTVAY